jgi:BON domain
MPLRPHRRGSGSRHHPGPPPDLWIDPSGLAITCTNGVVAIAGQVDRHSDKEFIIRWVKSIDGVVGLNADGLTYRIDDLALGKVTV